MEFHWRNIAKIAAYVDLTIGSLGLLFTILVSISIAVIRSDEHLMAKNYHLQTTDKLLTADAMVVAVALLLIMCYSMGEMYGAFNLLLATNVETQAQVDNALEKAKNWRVVAITLTIVDCFLSLITGKGKQMTVSLVRRALFLFFGYQFMVELDNARPG